MSTDALVDITVKFVKHNVYKYIKSQQEFNVNKLEKILKLTTTKSATNMHLFDPDQKIKKYASTGEIIDDYYPVRFKGYQQRKKYKTDKLNREVMLLSNKARFIEEQCQDIIDLRKKKKQVVIELLKTRGYDVIDDDEEYKYLRNMTIDSVEEENYEKLLKLKGEKDAELEKIKVTTIEQMWLGELKILEGSAKIISLIARDESQHLAMSQQILNLYRNKENDKVMLKIIKVMKTCQINSKNILLLEFIKL